MDILVGTTLGGYTLVRLLGSGGMGAVYLAEDQSIGQQVAIKVVRTDDGEYVDAQSEALVAERFRQEARAVASLDHLHILPLYRYDEEVTSSGRRAYMVMQYRPEGSLWDWLRRRAGLASAASMALAPRLPEGLPTGWPLSLEEATDYLLQAASALQYAHDRGLIHRDIKPANFLLRFDLNAPGNAAHKAFLLLSDFGLAKLFSASAATTQVFGTPTYMAPEQFEGIVGPESDQYALAVMIYNLLAGRPPFEGEPMRLMHQHLNVAPPPIRSYASQLPSSIEGVLARALAKKPAERYPSIAAFAEAFAQCLHESEATAMFSPHFSLPVQLQGQSNPNGADVLAAPTTYMIPQTPPYPPLSNKLIISPTDRFATASGPIYPQATPSNPSISSPGQSWMGASGPIYPPQSMLSQTVSPSQPQTSRRHVLGWLIGGALVATGVAGGTGLYFYLNRNPANSSSTQITPVVGSQGGTKTTPVTSGQNAIKYVLKGHKDTVASLAWSPDGLRLASGSHDHTARLWLLNSTQSVLTFAEHRLEVLAVSWNRTGTLIASGSRDDSVRIWDVSGTNRYTFANQGAPIDSIVWSLTNSQVIIGTMGNGVRELSLGQKNALPLGVKSIIRSVALSPNGRLLAVGAETGFVGVFEFPSLRRLIYRHLHAGQVLALDWSPDSTRLASGGTDKMVYVIDAASTRVTRSFSHDGVVNGVAWEPGQFGRLATAGGDGTMRIWELLQGTHTIYRGHTGSVTSVAWGTQGLATGSTDTTIILWNV